MRGIVIGFALVALYWAYTHRAIAIASGDVGDAPAAQAALARFGTVNTSFALVAAAVLASLAVFLFRLLDRTLRAEGAWLDETEATQEEEATRRRFSAELHDALEMAADEQEITRVVEHVLRTTVVDRPAELLLADSSEAHLAVMASHPVAGAPGCAVEAPFGCPAVRRASPQTFPSSTAVNACPHLRDRPGDPIGPLRPGHVHGPLARRPARHRCRRRGHRRGGERAAQRARLAGREPHRHGPLVREGELQAGTDSLTGLSNRRTGEAELSRRLVDGERLAVAIADLDHFKLLNDTYGHEAGDRALRLFADTVRASLRTEDAFARWGGEEFVIALPFADRFDARESLDRARLALAAACAKAGTPMFMASFGVADTTQADRLEELLRTADKALLRAKAAGRDRVHGAERLGEGEPLARGAVPGNLPVPTG